MFVCLFVVVFLCTFPVITQEALEVLIFVTLFIPIALCVCRLLCSGWSLFDGQDLVQTHCMLAFELAFHFKMLAMGRFPEGCVKYISQTILSGT